MKPAESIFWLCCLILLTGLFVGLCERRANAGGISPIFDDRRDRLFNERLERPRCQDRLDAYIDARIAEQAPAAVYRDVSTYWREGTGGAAILALLRAWWLERRKRNGEQEGGG